LHGIRFLPILAVLLIGTTVASVFAQQYAARVPILGTSGAPALSGNQFTGILTVLYADGMPVVLGSNKAALQLCASSCITLDVNLKQTAPGTYAYSFTPPSSLNGTIAITVLAGALADDNGRLFPSVDTQVGTYATPGLSSSALGQALPANPPPAQPQSNEMMRQAVALPQPTQYSPLVGIVGAVTAILLVAGAILILPSRRH
jgi:hypothetical protein